MGTAIDHGEFGVPKEVAHQLVTDIPAECKQLDLSEARQLLEQHKDMLMQDGRYRKVANYVDNAEMRLRLRLFSYIQENPGLTSGANMKRLHSHAQKVAKEVMKEAVDKVADAAKLAARSIGFAAKVAEAERSHGFPLVSSVDASEILGIHLGDMREVLKREMDKGGIKGVYIAKTDTHAGMWFWDRNVIEDWSHSNAIPRSLLSYREYSREVAREMFRSGKSFAKIQKEIGVHTKTLFWWLKDIYTKPTAAEEPRTRRFSHIDENHVTVLEQSRLINPVTEDEDTKAEAMVVEDRARAQNKKLQGAAGIFPALDDGAPTQLITLDDGKACSFFEFIHLIHVHGMLRDDGHMGLVGTYVHDLLAVKSWFGVLSTKRVEFYVQCDDRYHDGDQCIDYWSKALRVPVDQIQLIPISTRTKDVHAKIPYGVFVVRIADLPLSELMKRWIEKYDSGKYVKPQSKTM